MKELVPLKGIYYPDFIAANQADRADNVLPGEDKQEHLAHLRQDIRDFKRNNQLDKVWQRQKASHKAAAELLYLYM